MEMDQPYEQPYELFISAFLDDFGLTPFELRVLGRINRRAGKDGFCYESLPSMAKSCKMALSSIRTATRVLQRAGIIEGIAIAGETIKWRAKPRECWTSPANMDAIREDLTPTRKRTPIKSGRGSKSDTTPPIKSDTPPLSDLIPPPIRFDTPPLSDLIDKGSPFKDLPKGSPFKDLSCGVGTPHAIDVEVLEDFESEPAREESPIPQDNLDSLVNDLDFDEDKGSAKSSHKTKKQLEKLTAKQVYDLMADYETYDKAWRWYARKCADAPASSDGRRPSPGDKKLAAIAWILEIDQKGQLQQFRLGCRAFDFGSNSIPHLERFIAGKNHGVPYWQRALDEQAALEGSGDDFVESAPRAVASKADQRVMDVRNKMLAQLQGG